MIGIILLLFLTSFGHATPVLRVGDVLLQPLHCWVCSLIEAEEDSIYSHMGIVLETSPQILVGEAWGKVRSVPFHEFALKTEKGQRLRILRLKSQGDVAGVRETFEKFYQGRDYDPQFLWDNFDDFGEELLYCSEMIAKLLEQVTRIPMPTKSMTFQRHRPHWERYFNGSSPAGKTGNSPADFHRSSAFEDLGDL